MVPIPFAFSSQHRSSRVLSHTSRSIALPPNTAIQGFLCFLPLYSWIKDKRRETRKGRIRVILTVHDIHLKKDKDHWLMLLQLLFHSPVPWKPILSSRCFRKLKQHNESDVFSIDRDEDPIGNGNARISKFCSRYTWWCNDEYTSRSTKSKSTWRYNPAKIAPLHPLRLI